MSQQPDKPKRSRDSVSNTIIVAVGVSLVCSILVSTAAITLRPTQEANEKSFRQTIVLQVAGLYDPDVPVDEQFGSIEARIVDLSTGEFVDGIDATTFDPLAASNDPDMSSAIPAGEDIASLRRRENYAPVFLVSENGTLSQVILPVRGKGLWSTLYGYLSVEPDGNTVRGLKFYEHAETPGLGDGIDRPSWQALWPGKQLKNAAGEPQIQVVRGQAPPDSTYQVDGLSGATLTGRGVQHLVNYWAGPGGFGPFLARLGNDPSIAALQADADREEELL